MARNPAQPMPKFFDLEGYWGINATTPVVDKLPSYPLPDSNMSVAASNIFVRHLPDALRSLATDAEPIDSLRDLSQVEAGSMIFLDIERLYKKTNAAELDKRKLVDAGYAGHLAMKLSGHIATFFGDENNKLERQDIVSIHGAASIRDLAPVRQAGLVSGNKESSYRAYVRTASIGMVTLSEGRKIFRTPSALATMGNESPVWYVPEGLAAQDTDVTHFVKSGFGKSKVIERLTGLWVYSGAVDEFAAAVAGQSDEPKSASFKPNTLRTTTPKIAI